VGYSYIRPWLATKILYMFRKRETPEGKVAGPSEQAQAPWKKKIVDLVDRHLIQEGRPRLGKAALFSFLTLGAYFNALAFAIYGVSRLFGIEPEKTAPSSHSSTSASSLNPPSFPSRQPSYAPYRPDYYPAGFPGRYGMPLRVAAPSPFMTARLG